MSIKKRLIIIIVIILCPLIILFIFLNGKNRIISPTISFIGIREAISNDSNRFEKAPFPYSIITFSSDVDIMTYERGWPYPKLYGSATKINYEYSDLILNGELEKGIIESSVFELMEKYDNKYIYETIFYYDPAFWCKRKILDTIHCKIFFVKFSSRIKCSSEMLIPKNKILENAGCEKEDNGITKKK